MFAHVPPDRCFRPMGQPFSTDMQEQYVASWKSVFPETQTVFESTVEGALNLARSFDQGQGTHTLITGSLFLVSELLQPRFIVSKSGS